MKDKNPFLSIIIPAFNEERSLERGVLNEVSSYLSKQKYTWEVLIVSDGSTDRTSDIVSDFVKKHKGFYLLKESHRGKGGTVISGSLKSHGEIILFTDMDQSTPIDQLEKMLPKFKEGYDVVIGSRTGREGAPLVRQIMAYGFAAIRLLVLRLPYKDTQCGFKAFKSKAARNIFDKMKNLLEQKNIKGSSLSAGFDVEILYLARKLKYKVSEVPVLWHFQAGTNKNPIKESWIGLRGILAVRIKSLFGYYNLK